MIDYTALVRRIVADAAASVPALAHLHPERIAVLAATRGGRGRCGNLATCYGLRGSFEEGEAALPREMQDAADGADRIDGEEGINMEASADCSSVSVGESACCPRESPCSSRAGAPTFSVWTRGRRSRRVIAVSQWVRHRWPRIESPGGADCLYMIALRLPRMLLHDPLDTIFHELHHIGENGDGRLSPARHGPAFDRAVRYLAAQWRERGDAELVRRGSLFFDGLESEFGAVVAECAPPRLTMPLVEAAAAPEPYETAIERVHPGYTLMRGYEILPAPLSHPDAPATIPARALRLRHITREGAVALPRALAHYARRAGAAA